MSLEADVSENESFEPVVTGTTGQAVVVVVGLALWAQLLLRGLATEVSLTTPSPVVLAAYVAPPIILVAGAYLHSLPVLMFAVPLALLPGTAFLPEVDKTMFFSSWSMARIAATFALYLALTSAWTTSSRLGRGFSRRETGEGVPIVRLYRNHVLARAVPLLLLWLVPTYAIFFDDAVVGTFLQSFGEASTVAQIFASTGVFLVWAIVAYTSFIVPALNLEYDRRRLTRRVVDGDPVFDKKRIGIRLALVLVGGLIVIGLLLLSTS